MKEDIKDFAKSKWVQLVALLIVGAAATDMGVPMLLDPSQSRLFSVVLALTGFAHVACAILVFLENKIGYLIALGLGPIMIGAGFIRVAQSSPDVYLIDFLLIVLGLIEELVSIISYRRFRIDNPNA